MLALLAPLAAISPASAQQNQSQRGARGGIAVDVHVHSSEFGSPSGVPTLFETDPLEFPITEGPFSYSAIPCSSPAPFNDVGLKFNPDYPGITDPAPVRYLVEGTVTEVTPSGDRGRIEGTITTILCEDGEESENVFFTEFEARFRVTSENEAKVTGGRFEITGGTGVFADLTGSGSFRGRFTCLPPVLARNGAENCAELGAFSDAIFDLRGSFKDPTVPST